jgi:outer membrane protein OmpA-like peptidoglycan-associated protein
MQRLARFLITAFACLASALCVPTAAAQSRGSAGSPAPERIDYLTFAQGAVPVAIEGAGARQGANYERAVRIIDGNPQGFTLTAKPVAENDDTIFVYELPAPTTFDRFAVPNVLETPAPNQTFTKLVEIHGSAQSVTEGFMLLASATLQTHKSRGQVTEIPVMAQRPVRWVRLRLAGGITVPRPDMFFEFSEIVGNGTQAAAAAVQHFNGGWQTRALRLLLTQKGAVVSGCYDRAGDLTGTVTGNILRATGVDRSDKTKSLFILSRAADGSIRGVRSTNGAPFAYYTVDVAASGAALDCGTPAPPALGCDSIIHGITFDVDSAAIRAESTGMIDELYRGLAGESTRNVVIEGHTSSEGTDDYNLKLSERRAQAVVADLVKRGIAPARIAATGLGESRPIATNNDENGRSLNRRVEVKCR